ncbi:MAG: Na+/H+ antiporter subunit E [Paracoccaceae bacterium]
MLTRLFPHPLLSATLTFVWLGLVNTVTLGHLVLGGLLGIAVPLITAAYWPNRPKLRNPRAVVEYMFVVLRDIIVANVEVAIIIVFRRRDDIRSHYVTVPLDLTSPEAITVLAGTITLTPGTLSAALAADAGSILVHCLHTDEPEVVRDTIKNRYEARLKEIFP